MKAAKTPFYSRHLAGNARMVEFSGWLLPLEYDSVLREALSVRRSCGLFDASHMGEIYIGGRGAQDFLRRLLPNDPSLLSPYQMQYNLLLNHQAGVVDDLIVVRLDKGFLCVVNAANKEKVLNWLGGHNQEGVDIRDQSAQTALLALQGPKAYLVMEELLGRSLEGLGYMRAVQADIDGRGYLICRSGYTGEDGFEIYASVEDGLHIWDRLLSCRQEVKLCGIGARDILRVEAGYPLYGHEIDDDINIMEAGLGWVAKSGGDYIGKQALAKLKQEGPKRLRAGFVMNQRALPRQGYAVYHSGSRMGFVCSGIYSPNLEKFIGMAYIESRWACCEGSDIQIEVRGRLYSARVAGFPFIPVRTKRNLDGVRF